MAGSRIRADLQTFRAALNMSENRHRKRIDDWVGTSLHAGSLSFGDLILSLPGVYPKDALDSLARLLNQRKISKQTYDAFVAEAAGERCIAHPTPSRGMMIPISHPLDFGWRFGDRSVKYLLAQCTELAYPGDTVILLGTPGILDHPSLLNCRYHLILIDWDAEVISAAKQLDGEHDSIRCNLTHGELPEVEGRLVIVDPPWYPDYTARFLWSATQLCQKEGYILLCFPGEGTRPTISEEREKCFEFASSQGLSTIRRDRMVLPYRTPLFEMNALKVCGIRHFPPEWRQADLIIFNRAEIIGTVGPEIVNYAEIWQEYLIRSVRVRVRRGKGVTFEDPALISIVPNDILPSVSRRDKLRERIDVWTSGNRVYACKGLSTLSNLLASLCKGVSPRGFPRDAFGRSLSDCELNLVKNAEDQILKLLLVEHEEMERYKN